MGDSFETNKFQSNARSITRIELKKNSSERLDRGRVGQVAAIKRSGSRYFPNYLSHKVCGLAVVAAYQNVAIKWLIEIA